MSSKTFTSPENIKWNPVELRLDFFDWLGLDVAQGVVQDLVVKGRLHGFHLKRFKIRKHLTLSALSVKSFNLNQSSIQKMQCVGSHLSIFMFCTCYNLRWNLSKCDYLHIEWVVWQWKTLYNITPLKILFLFTWYTLRNVIACAPEGLWTLRQRTANRWCLPGSRAAIFQHELKIINGRGILIEKSLIF